MNMGRQGSTIFRSDPSLVVVSTWRVPWEHKRAEPKLVLTTHAELGLPIPTVCIVAFRRISK